MVSSANDIPETLPQYEPPAARSDAAVELPRAVIAHVEPESPAWDAGLEEGMVLTHVEGVPLSDMIEWQWQADGDEVEVTLDTGEVAYLEREYGQDWGLTFTDCIFDGMRLCCNRCTFCFMTMLPQGMRPALYLRDDDYRLSFLQGNFVTLTNLSEADFERIVAYGLSPLHVSVHAIDDDVREELIGPNAGRGKQMLQRLLEAGIEVHAQLVLVPGVNDGPVLVRTLGWLERYPNVLSVGLVPLGYTKFQKRFSRSYSEDPHAAALVIDTVREFQEDSRRDTRVTRYHIADEFYLAAGEDFPPAAFYDGYPQFFDGIGMMRSFIDDWGESREQQQRIAAAREQRGARPATIVTGTAFSGVLEPLIAASPLAAHLQVLPVENAYFGGNVDVTGLLTAQDVSAALQAAEPQGTVLLPRAMFNDRMLTLDGAAFEQLAAHAAYGVEVCTYSVASILEVLT